ncbi:MAG: TMEM175 family protein [Wenzhouxiangellaceae bacterium]|nr:TMEM175 family protein [Wenzhouxiangellaceae bacterium]
MTEDRFKPKRSRGMTRLETFTDAAFAFAVALLAISIDEIPGNYAELVTALKGAPAFLASFALLLLYWRAHQNWSDRYALEDLPSVLLTAALICLVMIYVYPLKIMFLGAFAAITGGWLPYDFEMRSFREFRMLVTIYGVGWIGLNLLIAALYVHAWSRREALGMAPEERFDTVAEAVAWLIVGSFGAMSIALAWTLPEPHVALAGWLYCGLAAFGPCYDWLTRRMSRQRFGEPQ